MGRLTPVHTATEPDGRALPDVPIHFLRRTAKIVGDVLWFAFLSVIFSSVSVGVAARLLF